MNKPAEDIVDRGYPREVKDALRKVWMIVIIGKMGSGKTTEATRIAKFLGKEVLVVSPNRFKVDLELFDTHKLNVLDKGKRIKSNIERLTKIEERQMTVIFDDAQALSKRQQEYITSKGLHTDLRHRNLTIIFVYHHPRFIPTRVLYGGDSFLIIKKGAYFTEHKLSQYLKVKKVRSVILDYCNDSLGEHDSLYLFNNGLYYHCNGSDILDSFKPRTRGSKYDRNGAFELLYQGLTISEVAEALGCGVATVYKIVKELKILDPDFTPAQRIGKDVVSELGFGFRDKQCLHTIRFKEPLRKGKASGEKVKRIERVKESEEKGNLATRVIGDILEGIYREIWPKSGVDITLAINEGRGGSDIMIKTPVCRIEIEVKNWKSDSTHRYLTPSDIKNKVLPRFSDSADIKWLFVCGVNCNKDAKRMLRENNVFYLNLTRKQITELDSAQKYRLRKRLYKWIKTPVVIYMGSEKL